MHGMDLYSLHFSTDSKILAANDVSEFVMKLAKNTCDYREKHDVERNDFMDILIKLKGIEDKEKTLTLNEIAAQTFAFFAAGFETSAITLTFCLFELAKNPEIQTKARSVIREAYEKYDGQFSYEMMLDLPYIDQILQGKNQCSFQMATKAFHKSHVYSD